MKNSFSILELLVALFISSIIIVYSATFIKELHFLNFNKQQTQIQKLELLSTKLFLEKKLNIQNRLSYKNSSLYFDNNLLLKNISSFSININSNILNISIKINDKISQDWSFKIE
ncbi:MAG: hypothetical protein ACQERD_00355 [Campylobacterota bacterium]